MEHFSSRNFPPLLLELGMKLINKSSIPREKISILLPIGTKYHPKPKESVNCHTQKDLQRNLKVPYISGRLAFFFRVHFYSGCFTNISVNHKLSYLLSGAGVYFWWQAGAAQYIQNFCDISEVKCYGASAGYITASLLLSGANFDE